MGTANLIDSYITRRNYLQCAAEDAGCGEEIWVRLGVANRHIGRVIDGELPCTPAVEREIGECLESVNKFLADKTRP